jgi:hypothetical protein
MPFKRVAEHINVAPLLKKLERHPELWGEITARQEAPGSPHKDTEAIFLRWCRDTARCVERVQRPRGGGLSGRASADA